MRLFLCSVGNVPRNVIKKAAQLLPPERAPKEGARADAFAARVAGTLLAHYAVRQLSPKTVCEKWAVTENGKPDIENCPVRFSISHTDGIVAVVASDSTPVGIDIEVVRPMREGFAARYFSESEQQLIRAAQDPDEALIRLWTAKEAIGKHRGTGLGESIPAIDTQKAASTVFEKDGARYALSVAPKCAIPPLEWIDFEDLVP